MELVQNPIHKDADVPQFLPPQKERLGATVNHYHVQDTHSKLALVTGFLFGFIAGYLLHAFL